MINSISVNISSRFSSNSEAIASELLENHEKCSLCTTYTMISLACFNSQPHDSVLSRREKNKCKWFWFLGSQWTVKQNYMYNYIYHITITFLFWKFPVSKGLTDANETFLQEFLKILKLMLQNLSWRNVLGLPTSLVTYIISYYITYSYSILYNILI